MVNSVYRIIKLVPRKLSNYISDKKILGQLINNLGLCSIFPRTYFDIPNAKNLYQKNNSIQLAFIKNRYGTGGKQVKCVNFSDLGIIRLLKDEIIQEGVQNIFLINSRKITLRFYVIIFDKSILLSKYAFGIIHGEKYISNSPSYNIQIKHEGYINKDSKIRMIPLEELSQGIEWLKLAHIKIHKSIDIYEKIRLNTKFVAVEQYTEDDFLSFRNFKNK